jgi:hypothetical protein
MTSYCNRRGTELDGKRAICIVPSEGLWELPFQALLSRSNKYVLEDHALSYAPSLSVLREMKKKAVAHALWSQCQLGWLPDEGQRYCFSNFTAAAGNGQSIIERPHRVAVEIHSKRGVLRFSAAS